MSSNSARVRPLGMMALVMCALVNSAKALFLPEACEHQECRPVRRHVTARATYFVPICWMLAEMLPTADSALLIKRENLLMWWFQGRLEHSRSHQGGSG